METNPNALLTTQSNTIFTNVGQTSDGGYYWEGLEKEVDTSMGVTSWLGEKWTPGSGKPAAHPNSRWVILSSPTAALTMIIIVTLLLLMNQINLY